MHNIKNGVYVRMTKFANYGSVIEDSIIAQQREADRRLKEIQAQRSLRKAKGGVWEYKWRIITDYRYD